MACCGGIQAIDTDLKNTPFEDIYLQIDRSKLKFFVEDSLFKLVESENKVNTDFAEIDKVNSDIERLNDVLSSKDKKISNLKGKISEIDKKIESMMQILSIDTTEKEYINDLGMKIEDQKRKSFIN